MDWDDIRIFLHVARAGQINNAARALGLDHSTVSRRLMRLESDVGSNLFDRAGRRLKITAAGENLLPMAVTMESLVLRNAGAIAGEAGRVRIGAPEGFGVAYLASRLPDIAADHSKLELELVALPRSYSLASREVDIAITLDRPDSGSVYTRRLTDYRLGFFASHAYLREHGPPATLDALTRHALCGYIPELLHTDELDYLDAPELRLMPRLRVTSIVGQREIVEAGKALAVLPYFMAAGRPGLVPVLVDAFSIKRSYWVSVHEDLRGIARVQTVTSELVRLVRDDADVFARVGPPS